MKANAEAFLLRVCELQKSYRFATVVNIDELHWRFHDPRGKRLVDATTTESAARRPCTGENATRDGWRWLSLTAGECSRHWSCSTQKISWPSTAFDPTRTGSCSSMKRVG
jgi:hypothetical protein